MRQSLRKAYEITDAKITFVSLVDKAANKRTFLMKKADDGKATFTTYGRIVKADAESHFVTGIVYEPMEEDTHGNFMTEEEITKAAYWFAKNGNKVDLQHSFEPLEDAAVVESWIAKADFEIDGETIRKGTWLMTVEVTDEDVWEGIQKGEITGFSMGGLGNYSEEDVDLINVEKQVSGTGEKKGLLKQLAAALGLTVVEKGDMAEVYEERSKGTLFWNAFSALEDTLHHYNPVSGTYMYETDEGKIRECLEDFNGIITSILTSGEPIAKAIQTDRPVEKAGKALSSKNLETLHGIRDSLDTFLKSFEPEEEPDDKKPEDTDGKKTTPGEKGDEEKPDGDETNIKKVKKEDADMNQQEVEKIVAAAIEKHMGGNSAQKPQEATGATGDAKVEKSTVPAEITAESVEKMVEVAVAKALAPMEDAEPHMDAEQIEEYIEKAVTKAVEPVLKAKGLPTNLGSGSSVEKNAGGEHYLHGIL
ncbi:putative serine protease XkdF [Fusobacterium naviforme]|nr:hypothetical protein F7P78_06310 [Fusobacterium naviforme]PSL10201.1 putative serine protease XkdF [Fusobacterium naviforme]STO27611.1 Uncharacterised protein [Fusobacterium naviforme]